MEPRGLSVLIEAQTAASISDSFTVNEDRDVTIVGHGFSGAETAPIEISYDGTNYVPVVDSAGVVAVSSALNPVKLSAPGWYRINKGITTGTVGVSKWENP